MLCYEADNGWRFPITDMLDIDSEHTDNPDEATTAVVLLPDNTFGIFNCHRRNIVVERVN